MSLHRYEVWMLALSAKRAYRFPFLSRSGRISKYISVVNALLKTLYDSRPNSALIAATAYNGSW